MEENYVGSKESHVLYNYSFTSRMHDIDAAGVMFFARFFYYAHDSYEAFLNQKDLSIDKILSSNIALPIKQSSATFKAPITINEAINIEIILTNTIETEFTLKYHFIDKSGAIRAELVSRHVCIDSLTKKRTQLPNNFFD